MLVDGPLVHVHHDEYLYATPEMVWADPDVEDAAKKLRRLYDKPDLRDKMGAKAAESIAKNFGVEAMAAKYKKRLQQLEILS